MAEREAEEGRAAATAGVAGGISVQGVACWTRASNKDCEDGLAGTAGAGRAGAGSSPAWQPHGQAVAFGWQQQQGGFVPWPFAQNGDTPTADAPARSAHKKMAKAVFTGAGADYFFSLLASSIFFMYFSGSLLKSFKQPLQQSLISWSL